MLKLNFFLFVCGVEVIGLPGKKKLLKAKLFYIQGRYVGTFVSDGQLVSLNYINCTGILIPMTLYRDCRDSKKGKVLKNQIVSNKGRVIKVINWKKIKRVIYTQTYKRSFPQSDQRAKNNIIFPIFEIDRNKFGGWSSKLAGL